MLALTEILLIIIASIVPCNNKFGNIFYVAILLVNNNI